jgi:hypothetical protein
VHQRKKCLVCWYEGDGAAASIIGVASADSMGMSTVSRYKTTPKRKPVASSYFLVRLSNSRDMYAYA